VIESEYAYERARSMPSFTCAMMMSALIVGARSSCGLRSKFMFSVK